MILSVYTLKTIFISATLLGYYWLFLRNKTFHRYNRYYLLTAPFISLIIPALHLQIPIQWNQNANNSAIRLLGVGQGRFEESMGKYVHYDLLHLFSWLNIFFISSLIISMILLVKFFKELRYLSRLRKNNASRLFPDCTIYFVSEKGTPFSFFKNIFWDKEQSLETPAGKLIFHHELFHVKQRHSLDILWMECFIICCWFNPFFHLMRRELKATHEYDADAFASTLSDKYEYARLLLNKATGSSIPLTQPFFHNQLKRRIAMITKSKNLKSRFMGRMLVLPMMLLLICLFAFQVQKERPLQWSSQSVRIIVDAGHGGVFPGASFNNIQEKNINLSIARKIQAVSKEYQIEVVMSREKDEAPGSNDLSESLNYVAGLADQKNANLFISIHVNGHGDMNQPNKDSGFEIYVPPVNHREYENSVKLASSISSYIQPDYSISSELKLGEHARVLKNATVPAVLIECGFIDNQADLKYILDDKNQEKIARDILEGVKKYSAQIHSAY